MDDLVKLDWNAVLQLWPLISDFIEKGKSGERIDLHGAIADVAKVFGVDDVDAFIEEKAHALLDEGLADVFDPELTQKLAPIFAGGAVPIKNLLIDFAQGDVKPQQLLNRLEAMRGENIEAIQNLLQEALNLPDETVAKIAEKLGPYTVSVFCLAATYMIYQRCAEDAALARERRIEAERLSAVAVAQLKAERAEMEEIVDAYLLDRILPFSEGAAAMDRAIAENDDDGFIQANAELWELFGRQSQYSTAEEFDDLMLSDEAFKL